VGVSVVGDGGEQEVNNQKANKRVALIATGLSQRKTFIKKGKRRGEGFVRKKGTLNLATFPLDCMRDYSEKVRKNKNSE